ncbi:MAG: RNA polymerase factor sigma-32 [Nannocystaceae bacterium]
MTQFYSDDGFQNYLKNIERYPVLDREEELRLATQFAQGDKDAGDLLVSCSLRYVVKIARKYRGYGYKLSELVAEGNLGLLQAVRRFEAERGLRFMTYGSYWVRANILAYVLKSWSMVSVGTGPLQSKLFFRLHREKSKLLATLGESAEITPRLAEMFGCSEDRIRAMQQRIDGRDLSLDGKAYRDSTTTVLETLRDERSDQSVMFESSQMAGLVRQRVDDAMCRFDDRERRIVRERLLGHDQKKTLSDLGKELGLSRERVRQLEQRVKQKLRRSLADLADDAPSRIAA